MAIPNQIHVTQRLKRSKALELTTASVALLTNAASSGKSIEITSLIVANIDGTNSATASLSWTDASNSDTEFFFASTVAYAADLAASALPTGCTLVLEEGDVLKGLASANGDLVLHMTYIETW
jgi:hypothetical protein